MISKDAKIYVAGHRGLVGSAIKRNLEKRGFTNIIGRTHKELDLLDPVAVREFFDAEKPEAVESTDSAECNRRGVAPRR